MGEKRFKCNTCGNLFNTLKHLNKHHKKKRHSGHREVINNKSSTKKPRKEKKSKGVFERKVKESGALEPVYESGFIRISDDAWTVIGNLLPDGASHHDFKTTGHHIIEFTGEAYGEIDFLMYLHNFVELEMFYEDIVFCLNMIPSQTPIGVKDMCELEISNILYTEGDVIITRHTKDIDTITNESLLSSLSSLSGVAIAYGKFKNDPTEIADDDDDDEVVTIEDVDSVIRTTSVLDEWGGGSKQEIDERCPDCDILMVKAGWELVCPECGEIETDDWTKDYLLDYQFIAEGFNYMVGGSWNSPVSKPPQPVLPKYHPIYGIRGNNLMVDRIVDLTLIIEEPSEEETTELSAETTSLHSNIRSSQQRRNIWKGLRNRPVTERLNITTTPVEMALEWTRDRFKDEGLILSRYIPHFKENYLSLQEECRLAINIPRNEMPVIDPHELRAFAEKLMGGSLDVFEPFADNRDKPYSPTDLVADTPEAMRFLYLGFKDGQLEDDVVNAKITRTEGGLLRPTQSEIWLDKVVDDIIRYGTPSTDGKGAYDDNSLILRKTIAVSQEGYILDGHHRYAQIVLVNPSHRWCHTLLKSSAFLCSFPIAFP